MKNRILIFVAFIIFNKSNFAQIDLTEFGAITLGVGLKSTTHQGFYVKSPITAFSNGNVLPNAEGYELPKESGKTICPEFKLYGSTENSIFSINADATLYYLGVALGAKDKNPDRFRPGKFSKLFSTPSPEIQSVESATDLSADKRFWCYDAIAISACFGKKSVCAGFNLVFKYLGFSWAGTYFSDNPNNYSYHETGPGKDNALRMGIGPSLGYRKSISNKIALLGFAGANYMPNIFGDPKYARQIINPFLNATIFIGGNRGIALSFNYQYLKTKNEFAANTYTSLSSTSQTIHSNIMVSQFETKLSFYLNYK